MSERLPEEYSYVIATLASEEHRSTIMVMYTKGSIFWEEEVVAWMPLPQPYVSDINVGKMEESEE